MAWASNYINLKGRGIVINNAFKCHQQVTMIIDLSTSAEQIQYIEN